MHDPESDRIYVEHAWPRYFSPEANQDLADPPLPAPDLDLDPFVRDIIPGQREVPWTNRVGLLTEQFAKIEPEFRGMARITHLTACTIVCLRRNPDASSARKLFWRLLNEKGSELSHLLNSRWLTSICDTVIDIAENDVDRAAALVGTTFINAIKIAETERRLYLPRRPWPPRTRLRHGGEIYDGVQTIYTVDEGDVSNLFERIERGLKIDSPITPIIQQLIYRAIEGDNCINRIIRLTGEPRRPMAPGDKVGALKEIMKSL